MELVWTRNRCLKKGEIRLVFCMRGLSWFLRRNWYGKRWGQEGCDTETIYLIDVGAITIGYVKG